MIAIQASRGNASISLEMVINHMWTLLFEESQREIVSSLGDVLQCYCYNSKLAESMKMPLL
jgi:hypothetical protein